MQQSQQMILFRNHFAVLGILLYAPLVVHQLRLSDDFMGGIHLFHRTQFHFLHLFISWLNLSFCVDARRKAFSRQAECKPCRLSLCSMDRVRNGLFFGNIKPPARHLSLTRLTFMILYISLFDVNLHFRSLHSPDIDTVDQQSATTVRSNASFMSDPSAQGPPATCSQYSSSACQSMIVRIHNSNSQSTTQETATLYPLIFLSYVLV